MKEYKYLVVTHWDSDKPGECNQHIMTAAEIFRFMDMSDCFNDELSMDIWRINGVGMALTECSFRNTWHDPADPLKMAIVGGGIKEIGYGTDH